jgi:hypothetical protein
MQHCVTFPCQNTMKKILLLTLTVLAFAFAKGQRTNALELNSFSRYDFHAAYTTRYFERSYTDPIKLYGQSHGTDLAFVKSFGKIKLNAGVGYYLLGVDKLKVKTPFGTSHTRTIDYHHPAGIKPLFNTNYYHYNNLNFSLGLQYVQTLEKSLSLNFGGAVNYLYTFSQKYHVTFDDITYRENNNRQLGFNVNAFVGLKEEFSKGKYYVNPKILVGIYQKLKGDPVFGEGPDMRLGKWMTGAGISVGVGKYL